MGTFTPVRHPLLSPSSRIKKKKDQFSIRLHRQSNRFRNTDYFAIIICQDWIKGKKEKNKYEFLIKESMKECGMRIFVAFRELAVIE